MRRALLRGGVVRALVLPLDRAGEVPRRALGHGARDAHAPPRVGRGVRPHPGHHVRAQDGTRRGMGKAPHRHREHRHRDVHQPEPRGDHQQVPRVLQHRRFVRPHRRRRGTRCGAWTRCLRRKQQRTSAVFFLRKTRSVTTEIIARFITAPDHSSCARSRASTDHGELQVRLDADRRVFARRGSVPAPWTRGGASAGFDDADFDAGFGIVIVPGRRPGERVRTPRGGGR